MVKKKFYICPDCQLKRFVPYSIKDESCPKRCQACSRLWKKLL